MATLDMLAHDFANSELNSKHGDAASLDVEDHLSVISDESEISATE